MFTEFRFVCLNWRQKRKYTFHEPPIFREWNSYCNPPTHTHAHTQTNICIKLQQTPCSRGQSEQCRRSTTQEIPYLLCNLIIHYCINNTLSMGINQDQIHISISSILQWLNLKCSLSLQALEMKFCTHFSSFVCVLPVPFILPSVNLLPHVRHITSPRYSNFTVFLIYHKHNPMLTFHADWRSYKLNF